MPEDLIQTMLHDTEESDGQWSNLLIVVRRINVCGFMCSAAIVIPASSSIFTETSSVYEHTSTSLMPTFTLNMHWLILLVEKDKPGCIKHIKPVVPTYLSVTRFPLRKSYKDGQGWDPNSAAWKTGAQTAGLGCQGNRTAVDEAWVIPAPRKRKADLRKLPLTLLSHGQTTQSWNRIQKLGEWVNQHDLRNHRVLELVVEPCQGS